MVKLTDLEYLQYSAWKKFCYRFLMFFVNFGIGCKKLVFKIGRFFKKAFFGIIEEFKDLVGTFKNGSWKTRISYAIMGFGNIARRQYIRGILFLAFEIIFIFYMIFVGGGQLELLFHKGSIGKMGQSEYTVPDSLTITKTMYDSHDESFRILFYGILTICFILALIYTWRLNIKQNKIADQILASGKKLKTDKEDLKSLLDENFHKTLLALPVFGIVFFTVIPIVFMIAVAFTNYNKDHDGLVNLWNFVGFENFNMLFSTSSGMSVAFKEIISWTFIWAFFATFSNYFLGILVAMMINKKGIKLKKLWRGILVLSSAVPQFISLLYISKFFSDNGIWNGWTGYKIWGDATSARVAVILINIWIGIPYLMLITSGVLMNIPADLYESARIDGANPFQQLVKITLPYMFFVTGPYLLTSFTGNMNNFNVIYLLTGGAPENPKFTSAGATAGDTDLLITWIYKLTMGSSGTNYALASVVGILIFLVIATFSLIVYSVLPSIKNEEDFS